MMNVPVKSGRRILALILAMILLAGCVPAAGAEEETADDEISEVQQRWVKYEIEAIEDQKYNPYMWYWVYVPENFEPGLPLVVYLHSSFGLCKKALRDVLPALINDGTIPDVQAVVLVPQLPGDYDNNDWLWAVNTVNRIVGRVMEEYEVDKDRISIAGFSLGGIGVWDVAGYCPGRYSRLMSICGKVHYFEVQPEDFEGCECRVFTAVGDPAVNSATAINYVTSLNEIGIPASHEALTMTHTEVPYDVLTRPEQLEWLWLIPEGSMVREEPEEGE